MSFYPPFAGGIQYNPNGINASGSTNTIGNIYTTGGNVGINTTSPVYALDVNGTIKATTLTGANAQLSGTVSATNLAATNVTFNSLIITGGNASIYSTSYKPTLNPDAFNSMIIYEDQSQIAPLSTFITTGSYYKYQQNTGNNNGYFEIGSTTSGSGLIYWNIHPGNSFSSTFDFWAGGGTGADEIHFFWYMPSIPAAGAYSAGLSNCYNVIFSEWNSTIALIWNGIVLLSVSYSNLGNSTWRTATVTCVQNVIRVIVNGVIVINYYDTTNRNINSSNSYLGFGCSTGGSTNNHRIRNIKISKLSESLLQFTDMTSGNMVLNGGNLGIGKSPSYTVDVNGTIAGTTLTGGNAQLSGTVSAGTFVGTLMSAGSIGIAGATVGTLYANSITSANAQLSGTVSAATFVGTLMSAGSIGIAGATVGTLYATSITSANVQLSGTVSAATHVGTLMSAASMGAAGVTVGTLYASSITGANLSVANSTLGNLYVNGTVYSVNITSMNMVDTNISSGTLTVSGLSSLNTVTGTNMTIASVLISGGNAGVGGSNALEFGYGVSGKEGNAGKIGYASFTANTLDIIGGGTTGSFRTVKIWDGLTVGAITTNTVIVGTVTAGTVTASNIGAPNISAGALYSTTVASTLVSTSSLYATNISTGSIALPYGGAINVPGSNFQTTTLMDVTFTGGMDTTSIYTPGVNGVGAKLTIRHDGLVTVASLALSGSITSSNLVIKAGGIVSAPVVTSASAQISGTVSAGTLVGSNLSISSGTVLFNVNSSNAYVGNSTDTRGMFTVNLNSANSFASDSDILDANRTLVVQNPTTTTTGNTFAAITMQISPSLAIPGPRTLGDIKFYRESLSTGSYIFTSYNSGGFKDLFKMGYNTSYVKYGNFGIGTTAPAYTLDVAGTINASTAITTGTIRVSNVYGVDFTNYGNQQIGLANLTSDFFGFGANNGAMQYQSGIGGSHVFYVNSSTGSSNGALGTRVATINASGISTANMRFSYATVGNILITSGNAGVGSGNYIELGYGSNKQGDAGKLGYGIWTANVVDFVGGGTTNDRTVKIWENLLVPTSITTANLRVNTSTNDAPAINPDAFNTLIIYEDMTGTALRSGTLAGSATFDNVNDYVELTPALGSKIGYLTWQINPGNAFILNFEFYSGSASGADLLGFIFGSSSASLPYIGNTGAVYGIFFNEYSGAANNGTTIYQGSTQLARNSDRSWADSAWHTCQIIFFRNQFRINVDGANVLNYLDTTARDLTGNTYMGFIAATGASNNSHRVRNIRMSKYTESLWAFQGQTSSNIVYNGGNVGIGQKTPAYTLDVGGNVNFTGSLYQNGVLYSGGGGGTSQWTSTAGSSISYTSGSVVVSGVMSTGTLRSSTLIALGNSNTIGNLVTTSGNVYIGTNTTPAGIVVGSGNFGLYGTNGANNVITIDGVGNSVLGFLNQSSLKGAVALAASSGNWASDARVGDMVFRSNQTILLNANGGGTSTMIVSGGNVGIGTGATIPAYTLDVSGTINASTAITTASIRSGYATIGNLYINNAGTPSAFLMNAYNNSNHQFQLLNYGSDNVSLNFDMYYDGSAFKSSYASQFQIYKLGGVLNFNYGTAAAGASTSLATAMSINTSGIVSIGTLRTTNASTGNIYNSGSMLIGRTTTTTNWDSTESCLAISSAEGNARAVILLGNDPVNTNRNWHIVNEQGDLSIWNGQYGAGNGQKFILSTNGTCYVPTVTAGTVTASNIGAPSISAGTLSATTLIAALNNQTLYIRNNADASHTLQYYATVDGPKLTGFAGGALGAGSNGATDVLKWNTSGINVSGAITTGTVLATTVTTTTLIATTVTAGTVTASNIGAPNISASSLYASSVISSANIQIPAAGTISAGTHVGTLVSSANLRAGYSTISNLLITSGGVGIGGANMLEFGWGIAGKEINAGKIGYASFTSALDIVGAGTTDRTVRIFDNLTVGGITTGTLIAGTVTAGTVTASNIGAPAISAGTLSVTNITSTNETCSNILIKSGTGFLMNNGDDAYNQLQLFNGGHGNISLNFDMYYTTTSSSSKVSSSTSYFQIAKSGSQLHFIYGTSGAGSSGNLNVPLNRALSIDSSNGLVFGSLVSFGNLSSNNVTISNLSFNYSTISNLLITSGGAGIGGANMLEFGWGIAGKQVDAGRIGYAPYTANTLEIIGAGTASGNRIVKIWDMLTVSDATVGTLRSTTITSANLGILNTTISNLNINNAGGASSATSFVMNTNADAYPNFQILNYAHDLISLNFDMYWNGAWTSSHASQFQIMKLSNLLQFNYGSTAAGSTFGSFNTAMSINTSGVVSGANLSFTNATISNLLAGLNNKPLYIYSLGDVNHTLSYASGNDGPKLKGYGGGALSVANGDRDVLTWNTTSTYVMQNTNANYITNNNISAQYIYLNTSTGKNGLCIDRDNTAQNGSPLLVMRNTANITTGQSVGQASSHNSVGLAMSLTYNDNSAGFTNPGTGTIQAMYMYYNGDINNKNNLYGATSDRRLKENIIDARDYLDDLNKLRVVKYSFKDEHVDTPTHLGLIAQEVEEIFPNLVITSNHDTSIDENGEEFNVKTLKTSVINMMMLKAIQELTAKNQTLTENYNALLQRIEALENK